MHCPVQMNGEKPESVIILATKYIIVPLLHRIVAKIMKIHCYVNKTQLDRSLVLVFSYCLPVTLDKLFHTLLVNTVNGFNILVFSIYIFITLNILPATL